MSGRFILLDFPIRGPLAFLSSRSFGLTPPLERVVTEYATFTGTQATAHDRR